MRRFRSFDNLRSFVIVANHLSFTKAAEDLNLTKGAVSYQINRLETELGFPVFSRQNKTIELTKKGQKLLQTCEQNFSDLEVHIAHLQRDNNSNNITIGMSTYFASRWLSSRLMRFMASHPHINIRIQPLINLVDLTDVDVDLVIRWGNGDLCNGTRRNNNSDDANFNIECIFTSPAMLCAGKDIYLKIQQQGIESVIHTHKLLHDGDGSDAWKHWFDKAGIVYDDRNSNSLVIPDPNVRVQAVIDNQGLAINDFMVSNEQAQGMLQLYDEVVLDDYGYYLLSPKDALDQPAIGLFRGWIMAEASDSA